MNINIGVLAYNEAALIAQTLSSLFQQSIFQLEQPLSQLTLEIIVIPNGCTDETAAIAEATLKECVERSPHQPRYRICDVEQRGKSNAWNLYVHEFSDPAAEYLILMDADIQFLNPCTLHDLVEALQQNPEAWISVGLPVKDVALKSHKSLIDRLSVAISKSAPEPLPTENSMICGQLYCSRAKALRAIWMPIGLPVEDGFLRAVACTEGFTMPENSHQRVKFVKSATHVFAAYTHVASLLNHEKRLIIGSVINAFLYDYLWKNCHSEQTAGSLIRLRNYQDPNWLNYLLQEAVAKQGWWVISPDFYLRRWRGLRSYPMAKKILRLPLVIVASLADWLVCVQANSALKRGEGIGYWGTKQQAKVHKIG